MSVLPVRISQPRHLLYRSPVDTVDKLVAQYNDTLAELIDHHAPEMTKTISFRPHAPWYTDSLRDAKRVKRQLERLMVKSGLQVDKPYSLQGTV